MMQSISEITIRHPRTDEHESVRELIRIVATEAFSDLFAPNPVPLILEEDDWSLAWVAVRETKIIGVLLSDADLISDLWVLRENRRQGVGGRLLARGESEIFARGYTKCRLRVVKSNRVAVEFYLGQAWHVAREFAHEKYHHPMLEMAKSNNPRLPDAVTCPRLH
jgi:ribosomal protein S18 acetylase RimI-like enzyme